MRCARIDRQNASGKRRVKSALAATAIAVTALLSTAGSADALGRKQWTRDCGTTYTGVSTRTVAETVKHAGGRCEGHAWLRASVAGAWTQWVHASGRVQIVDRAGRITGAQHKGCSNCRVYAT